MQSGGFKPPSRTSALTPPSKSCHYDDAVSRENMVDGMADADEPTPEELDSVLAQVPKGAMALAGLTVILLLVAWFAMYAFVFLPRGQVG